LKAYDLKNIAYAANLRHNFLIYILYERKLNFLNINEAQSTEIQ